MDSFAWALVSDQMAELAGGNAVAGARGGVLLPPMLGFQLPPRAGLEHENFLQEEPGFVQPAVRSSCFGAGNGTASNADHHANVTAGGGGGSDNAQLEAGGVHDDGGRPNAEAASGACSSQGPDPPDSKKRKRSNEDVPAGTDQAKEPDSSTCSPDGSERSSGGVRGNGNGPAAAAKRKGKEAVEADEVHKEEYIHVRARKGQATNNHSRAERLRREKINERMKLLQDLVPGCSKIIGKSLMLDEIINYVQSLQRQVEFLSMKLATVNPQLGLGIQGLLSKDQLISFPGAPSSAPIGLSFSQEMIPKLPLMPESGMLQGGVHGVGNSNVFRTIVQEQQHEQDFSENASQMPHNLDGSFHRAGQLAYRPPASLELLSIKPTDHDGFHF